MSMSKSATPNQKPVVRYLALNRGKIEVGHIATVIALDHPSHLIAPGDVVNTSRVLSYDEATGEFETRNSIYKLAQLELELA